MATDPRDGVLIKRILTAFAISMVAVFFIVQFFARNWPGRDFTNDRLGNFAGVLGALLAVMSVWLVHRAFGLYRRSRP